LDADVEDGLRIAERSSAGVDIGELKLAPASEVRGSGEALFEFVNSNSRD